MSMTPERAGEIGKEYLDRCMGNGGVTPSEEFLKRKAYTVIAGQIGGLIEQKRAEAWRQYLANVDER
jgi:hypothetical protein